MLSAVIGGLTERRGVVLVVVLLIACAMAIVASRVKVDNSLEVWFVDNDPTLVSYHDFLEQFGNDEVVVTTIGGGRFDNPDRLRRLRELSDTLATIPGVARVMSLANIPAVDRSTGMPRVTPIVTIPVGADDVARARDALRARGIASRFVGPDASTLVVLTWMSAGPELETERGRIIDDVRGAAAASVAGTGDTVNHAGLGVVYDALNRSTLGEGATFILVSYLVMFVLLYLLMRRLTWVILALIAVTLANIGLMATMVLFGRPVNMITMALPPLVMILGIANVVHMATDLDLSLSHGERSRDQLTRRLTDVTRPCAVNATTTTVAFLSLTTASMAVTRDYGLFAAFGIVYAFVFSLLGMAWIIPRATRFRPPGQMREGLTRAVEKIFHFAMHRRGLVVALSILTVGLSAWGISRIVVDTYSIDFLPGDHPVRAESAAVEAGAGPYVPLELTVHPVQPGTWRRVEFLRGVAAAQEAVEADPSIGRTTTILDVLRDMHVAVAGDSVPRPWVPATDEELEQLMGLVERWGDTLGMVAGDGSSLRLTATTPMASVRTFSDVGERVTQAARRAAAGRARVEEAGYLPLYGQMITHILDDQTRSFALAFLMVFIVVALALRSWRFTLVAIPPNVLPVAMVLGVMGLANIRLDIATVTVAAVALGIIVDDTVHILYRFKHRLALGDSLDDAARTVARTTGVAVVSSSIVFCVGFAVVTFAGTSSVANVGLLTAVAVAAALVTDLFLLPACISYLFRGKA